MKISSWIWKTVNAVVYLFGVIFIFKITVFSFFVNYYPSDNQTRSATSSLLPYWSHNSSLLSETELTGLKSLWEPKKNALLNSHTAFAENIPPSYFVFCLLPETGDVFSSMIFNLDCGCPLNSHSINVLQYIVDNSDTIPLIIDSAFYQGVSMDGYPFAFFPLTVPEKPEEVISRK